MSIWANRSTQEYLAQLSGLQKASWRLCASFLCADDISITRRKVMRLWEAAWAWEQLPGVCWSLLCVRWSGRHAMESSVGTRLGWVSHCRAEICFVGSGESLKTWKREMVMGC